MKKTVKIIISCGEKTCARKPGKFCKYLGTSGMAQTTICRLFPTKEFSFTILKEKRGWTQRCKECLKFSV